MICLCGVFVFVCVWSGLWYRCVLYVRDVAGLCVCVLQHPRVYRYIVCSHFHVHIYAVLPWWRVLVDTPLCVRCLTDVCVQTANREVRAKYPDHIQRRNQLRGAWRGRVTQAPPQVVMNPSVDVGVPAASPAQQGAAPGAAVQRNNLPVYNSVYQAVPPAAAGGDAFIQRNNLPVYDVAYVEQPTAPPSAPPPPYDAGP